MFFVLISFAFCSQREPNFQWNMGFKIIFKHFFNINIPINIPPRLFKLVLSTLGMSQMSDVAPSFHFIQCRNSGLKKVQNVTCFFVDIK